MLLYLTFFLGGVLFHVLIWIGNVHHHVSKSNKIGAYWERSSQHQVKLTTPNQNEKKERKRQSNEKDKNGRDIITV